MKSKAELLPQSFLIFASFVTAIALFFFLTSGIPLIQLGLLPELGEGKKPYLKVARHAALILAVVLVLLRWKAPLIFNELWLVRVSRKIIQLPLGTSVTVLFLIYGLTLSSVSLFRHLALETRAFDLGIFAQAVWTTLHGSFLYSSLKEGICLLGDHVSPILAFLAVPYAVWPDPRTLLILQAFAAAASFFPLAILVQEQFSDKKTALVFCLMYFFYLPTRAAVHEDFHPEVLVEPMMFWAFLWLKRGRYKLFLLALAVILGAKENMAGIVCAFGLYAAVFNKKRVLGAVIMFFSIGYLLFCTRWLVPQLSGQPYFYSGFYAHLAEGGGAGFLGMLSDSERWEYLLKIYGPFLFLPLWNPPTLLLTFPVLFQNLLSRNGVARSLNYHYTTGLTPFIFISTVMALSHATQRFSVLRKYGHVVLAMLLAVALLRSGAPEYFYGWDSAKRITPRTILIRQKMLELPPQAIVITHNNLIPQTANRRGVYQFDYNALQTKTQSALAREADIVVLDEKIWESGTVPLAEEMKTFVAAGYRVDFESDHFYILKKELPRG